MHEPERQKTVTQIIVSYLYKLTAPELCIVNIWLDPKFGKVVLTCLFSIKSSAPMHLSFGGKRGEGKDGALSSPQFISTHFSNFSISLAYFSRIATKLRDTVIQ